MVQLLLLLRVATVARMVQQVRLLLLLLRVTVGLRRQVAAQDGGTANESAVQADMDSTDSSTDARADATSWVRVGAGNDVQNTRHGGRERAIDSLSSGAAGLPCFRCCCFRLLTHTEAGVSGSEGTRDEERGTAAVPRGRVAQAASWRKEGEERRTTTTITRRERERE